MDINMKTLTIGALLHDIGKITRRTDKSTGNHINSGYEYLFNKDIKLPNKDIILDIVKNHHYDDLKKSNLDNSHLAWIVYEADNIASGIDRRKLEEGKRGNEMSLLSNIFNNLYPNKNTENKQVKATLEKEDDFYLPIERQSLLDANDYYPIRSQIDKNLKAIDYDIESPNSILKVLEATTTKIPSSSYVDYPDISLYDHLKITALIASNMYLYMQSLNDTDYKDKFFKNSKNSRKEDMFILVSGELSGIQDFIYTVANKGAMKSLRGRSFYLEMLVEHIVDEILQANNLSRANLLYLGGGNFYLILPNTKDAKDILEKFKTTINDFLLKRYQTNLYFEMNYQKCSANDLANDLDNKNKENNLLGNVFRKTSAKTSKSKLNRYSKEQLSDLFNPDSHILSLEDLKRECKTCGLFAPKSKEEDECNYCLLFKELGSKLAYINITNEKYMLCVLNDSIDSKFKLELPLINGDTAYINLDILENTNKILKNSNIIHRLYAINQMIIGKGISNYLWIGNYNTKSNEKETLIEFDELVNRAKGIKRLAVLRADVDSLGDAFVRGFENDKENKYKFCSLSRSAVFSRQMSDFFKRYINIVANCSNIKIDSNKSFFLDYLNDVGAVDKSNNYIFENRLSDRMDSQKRDIVIVYSGGDDVFAIGTWNDIIEFSIDLRNLFKEFAQEKLTFSAGIGFFSNGYPISKMAQNVGELESIAKEKDYGQNISKKDSIALFGKSNEEHVYKWDVFINDIIGDKLKKMNMWFDFTNDINYNSNKLIAGKSFLYKIMDLTRNRIQEDSGLNLARFAYLLARREPKKSDEKLSNLYDDMCNTLFAWLKDKEEAKKFLTTLQIIIYTLRE